MMLVNLMLYFTRTMDLAVVGIMPSFFIRYFTCSVPLQLSQYVIKSNSL